MIKAVIFDIDNTLYSFDDAHAVAMEALYRYAWEQLGMDSGTFTREVEECGALAKKRLDASCAAIHNRLLRFQLLMERRKLPLRHATVLNELYWNTLIAAAKPTPGSLECLRALREAGYILGIGTDMTIDFQLKKLEKLNMLHLIDFIVSSEEVNIEKPDSKLFLTCAEKAGVRPEECLFIGDSLKKDVLGPRAAGMESVWFCPDREKAEQHPELESICHFSQLTKGLLAVYY